MSNTYIQLPPDGAGKKLDADELTVGANQVLRERDRIAGANAAEIADVRDSDPALTDYGIVIRPLSLVGPVRDTLNSLSLSPGSSVNLDGTAIASGKTGKLAGVACGSTAPCKWDIKTRDGAVEVPIAVIFTSGLSGRPTCFYQPPDKLFDTLVYGDGDENFRVTATNLDPVHPAAVYVTIYWDEG